MNFEYVSHDGIGWMVTFLGHGADPANRHTAPLAGGPASSKQQAASWNFSTFQPLHYLEMVASWTDTICLIDSTHLIVLYNRTEKTHPTSNQPPALLLKFRLSNIHSLWSGTGKCGAKPKHSPAFTTGYIQRRVLINIGNYHTKRLHSDHLRRRTSQHHSSLRRRRPSIQTRFAIGFLRCRIVAG